ncbi:MAG: serine/threonine protein kinase/WD40 repeat protein [Chlamydiales bacterium]|jgi:serine/threonine protein kinase/WD40 repeat protein
MSRPDPTPSELFARFMERSGADFEELCAEHPEHAPELRQQKENIEQLERFRGNAGVAGPMTVLIQKHYGEQVSGPRIALDEDAGGERVDSPLMERLYGRTGSFGRYELKAEVGRGGQGAILRVWDEDLRRSLAMKVLLGTEVSPLKKPVVEAKKLGRFLEEAQITGQLDHPGIVPVHELGLDSEGGVYFTMKLVRGDDLRTIIEKVHGPGDEWGMTRALAVILKVCESVSYAHAKGVVHRDLKPGNVMVGRYGEVYVMDWGLARVVGQEGHRDVCINKEQAGSLSEVRSDRRDRGGEEPDSPLMTREGDVVGTPAFMSPEQARGELDKVGPRADVYSIGAMLYELLTGQMPYVSPGSRVNNYAIWGMLQNGPPKRIERIVPELPEELIAICDKAMAREKLDRYQSVAELRRDLQAYLGGRVVQAYETGALVELKKWVLRNRALAAAAAAVVLLLVVGLIAMSRSRQEIARERAVAERAARETGWQGYVANLRQAASSLESEAYAEARRRLDACRPEFRDWEWRHLQLRLDQSIHDWSAHDSAVTALVFDARGRELISASADSSVRGWNPSNGSLLTRFASASGPVLSLAFLTGDEARLSGAGGGELWVWNDRGQLQGEPRAADPGSAHTVVPGTDLVISARPARRSVDSAGAMALPPNVILASIDGRELWSRRNDDALAVVAASSDGERIAVGGRQRVYIYSRSTGNMLASRPMSAAVNALAFDPGGGRIALGLADGRLELWSIDRAGAGARAQLDAVELDTESSVGCVAFSPDGERLVVGLGSGRLAVVNCERMRLERDLLGHASPVLSLAFAPDGQRFASGARSGKVRIWRSAGAASITDFDTVRDSTIRLVQVDDAGSRVVAMGGLVVRIWNAADGAPVARFDVIASAFDGASNRLFLVDLQGRRRVVDCASGDALAELTGATAGGVVLVDIAPGGERVALVFDDGSVELQAVGGDGDVVAPAGTLAYVEELGFSPDGRRLVARDHEVLVAFDAASGRGLPGHELGGGDDRFFGFACDPRGQYVAFTTLARDSGGKRESGSLGVLDLETGAVTTLLASRPVFPMDALVTPDSIAFSPDGGALASGVTDGSLRLWSRDDWSVSVIQGPAKAWRSITFDPGGKRIWARNEDSTGIGVFDSGRAEWLFTLPVARGYLDDLAYDGAHDRLLLTSDYGVLLSLDGALEQARGLWQAVSARAGLDETIGSAAQAYLVSADAAALRADDDIDSVQRERLLDRLDWVGDPSADDLNELAWSVVDPGGERRGDVVRALRVARAARKLAPSSPEMRETLAWALFFNERYVEAESEGIKAVELAPVSEKGSYRESLEQLRREIPKQPSESR